MKKSLSRTKKVPVQIDREYLSWMDQQDESLARIINNLLSDAIEKQQENNEDDNN
jgi:hypothetical protein